MSTDELPTKVVTFETADGKKDVEVLIGIDKVPLDQLEPYVNNPKEHPDIQVGKIASSINEFKWDNPMTVDANLNPGEIVKGHGRYLSAKRLGMKEVPVLWKHYDNEAQKRADRLADNRSSESGWDPELLSTELGQLDEADYDLELTTFDMGEIEDHLEEPDFAPVDEEDQPKLDETDHVKCPECGNEFTPGFARVGDGDD